MDNISQLLQEARPLYFVRKKRRQKIKIGLCSVLSLAMLGFWFLPRSSYVDNGEWFDYEQYMSEVSPIEEMGLPVDEYGLLMVS